MEASNSDLYTIDAGSGDDIIQISGSNSAGAINANAGNDKIYITGKNNTNILTGDNDDTIYDMGESNAINNSSGDDIYYANSKNSVLTGISDVILDSVSGSFIIAESNKLINIVANDNTYKLTTTQENSLIDFVKTDSSLKLSANNVKLLTPQEIIEKLEMEGSNNEITLSNSQDSSFRITGDLNNIKAGDGNYDITVCGADNNVTFDSGTAFVEVQFGSNNTNIYGNDANTTVLNLGIDTFMHNCNALIKEVDDIDIQAGITSEDSSRISIGTGIVLGRLSFDTSRTEYAKASIDKCDSLIELVTKKVNEIGSQYNRLSSAEIANQIEQENEISTLSTLRDADITEVTSEYVRNLILQNASSILSITSSNLHTESVIRLLYSIK